VKRWTTTAALALALGLCAAPAAWGADAPPYHDLNSVGGLYLCDKSGNAVSTGSIDDKPFTWFAVSRVPAPKGFGGAGASATLYAYQPRQDAYPDRWNGDTLTAASGYQEGDRPTAVGTPLDFTLRDFLSEYPLMWDDTVQLRMYFGSKAHGYDGTDYASADLKVTGTTWTMLSDASGDCGGATHTAAQSSEITVAHLNPSASASPRGSAGARPGATGSAPVRPGAAVPAPRATARPAADLAAARAASAASWSTVLGRAGAAVALAALVSLVVTRLRRRSAARA
jgi:hypothetical protein